MPTKKDPFKDLKELPFSRGPVVERAATRMVKVMRPLHGDCQHEFKNGRGWWKICDQRGHDPYFRSRETIKKVAIKEKGEDGRTRVTGYEEIVEGETRPNIKAVPMNIRINSAQSLQKGIVNRGYRPVTDFGYKPLCEMRNCEAPGKVDTRYGRYCTERHARLVAANEEEKLRFVENPKKQREVLDSINLYGD